MVCQRCRGLLVRETFEDLSPEAGIHGPSNTMYQLWIYRGLRSAGQSPPPSCGKTSGASRDSQKGRSRVPKTSL